ncbi:MAG: CGNR zinc finger domain-containing protein [Leifsonia sp.]
MAHFTLLGEPLAIDLVNTLKTAHTPALDQLDADDATEEFWAFQAARSPRPLAGLTKVDTIALRALTAELLASAREGRDASAPLVARANAVLAAAPEHPNLQQGADGLEVTVASPADGMAEGTRAAVIRSLLAVLDALRAGRLRECAAEDCSQLFVATNSKRRWCTPDGCGNRARVARHAAKARASH